MKLSALAILAVAAASPAAQAMPHFGRSAAIRAAPSFLVQVRHHHHRHHWRHWSRDSSPQGETAEETAPEATGSSAAPESAARVPNGSKPKIEWVDPGRAGR
jgi:hypothetical protein